MRRREFITLIGGAAATWPVAAKAQQPAMPVVGFLHVGSPEASVGTLAAFRAGLAEAGYVEGRNVEFAYRWAEGQSERLPQLAADLVKRRVAVIATPGNSRVALIAKAATSTIPIVFSMGGDPVEAGLVASYNRPGGNVTGISSLNTQLGSKRVQLLFELVPTLARFALLVNPLSPNAAPQIADVRSAVSAIHGDLNVLGAATIQEIEPAFMSIVEKHTDAMLISPGFPFNEYRASTVAVAARYKIPTAFAVREWTEAGGLMSYGPIVADEFHQTGIYAGRVLNGEKPVDLPILRPTKFEFVFNLKTAKALGLEVPPILLTRADEVIE